ncbi:hypothetical protein [Levilactobacillus suantsaii]|uniref:Uncharacterized protein n=1 Tax=Levilactobacillus suantsaii TaxID=2292255 RepID=A0A4Q0VJW8_9LACO|nr:hypothetical protein [Levilactobacillus suantsaii]QMU08219.1 hypothetical protein H3M12_00600 [Levilactobacillus suantsaii]RXI79128.1 hypothetical protein DXH47_04955 [Levilactobacillus suantsaii]
MVIIHVVAEIIVFFAAISLIYYFFQITQAHGERKQNLIYLAIALGVLIVAYPISNLAGKSDVSPTNQVSHQVDKAKKRHQSVKKSSTDQSKPATSSSESSHR